MTSTFKLNNPYLNENEDHLYHFGVRPKDDLNSLFGDIKFVCAGGKSSRMKNFAEEMYRRLGLPKNSELDQNKNLRNIGEAAGRYCMYKVGEVLIVSHGIGMASLLVVLNEIFKLLHYAKCGNDVKIIRIGSSGGLGVEPGSLVITNQPYNSLLQTDFKHVFLGQELPLPCVTSDEMRRKLLNCAHALNFQAIEGNTLSSDDFFEGQGRIDGAFCSYEEADKMTFLQKVHDELSIKNMEMESTCLAAMCNRAGLECAIICTILVNRLKGDVVDVTDEEINTWQNHMFQVVGEYIQKELEIK